MRHIPSNIIFEDENFGKKMCQNITVELGSKLLKTCPMKILPFKKRKCVTKLKLETFRKKVEQQVWKKKLCKKKVEKDYHSDIIFFQNQGACSY